MGAPHRFLRKLHDVIGAEATDAMGEWMNRTEEKLDELRADLAELRHEMNTGFAKIEGQLGLIAQALTSHGEDIADLERRVTALEERRIPIGPLAAVSGAVSAIVAAVALIMGQ